LFTTAQPPRSASGQDTKTFLTAGLGQRRSTPPRRGHRSCIRRIRAVPLTVWALGFNQFRLRHAIRASTGQCLGGFSISGLLASMLPSPWGFPPGKLDGPGVVVALELLLSAKGINLRRDTTHPHPGEEALAQAADHASRLADALPQGRARGL